MRKFFRFHDYSENMKAIIATFNLKGREVICCEDVKNVKGINDEDLIWNEFERLFRRKYPSERHYN